MGNSEKPSYKGLAFAVGSGKKEKKKKTTTEERDLCRARECGSIVKTNFVLFFIFSK